MGGLIQTVRKHFLFFIIIVLVILFSYPYHEGISPFDPSVYTKCAINILHGVWDFENFYCNRVVSYLPIAIAIKIFGFNGYYLSWVTVFELVILLMVLYLSLRKYNPEIALITCALVGFTPLVLELSGTLYGDIMATLTSNLCILWIWHIRFTSTAPHHFRAGVILTLIWFVALLTKEYAIYYLLPILILFVGDKRKKRLGSFWNAAFISAVVLGVVFLAVYVLKTGDIFYRLHIIENIPNMSTESYTVANLLVILTRITILPVKFLIKTYSYFIVFSFSLIHLFNKAENEKEKFIKMYMISLLALWWMGTQSLRNWTPILLNDRLWLPLIVPMAMNAAHVLLFIISGNVARYSTWKTKIILLVASILILAVGYQNAHDSAGEQVDTTGFIFLRLGTVGFAFLAIFYRDAVPNLIELIKRLIGLVTYLTGVIKRYYILIIIILFPLIYNFRTLILKDPRDNNYLSELEQINFLRQTGKKSIVISEKSTYMGHGIYYGFDNTVEQQFLFMDWNTIDTSKLPELARQYPVYLLITFDRLAWYVKYNKQSDPLYPKPSESVPDFVVHPERNWKLVKDNSRSALYIYTTE